ncbi:MAG: MBL fold metallo-hydrolase [Candidatus Omnitrophota bacterium]|nr:MBL fold metallo-hydrolase [Candidatus Omnitrophota bacterium]
MSIRVKFCGGVRTVTGSRHLVSTDKSQVLLDCGIFHGHREEYYIVNSRFSFNPAKLNSLILSHAHIDHCGNIPTIIKRGFHSKIYTTTATRDLCRLMLADSGKIQEEDVKFLNKINRRLNKPNRKPLYTQKEAEATLKYFRGVHYGKRIKAAKDISCTFFDAGHILGSAVVLLEIKDGKKITRLGYIVDLGRAHLPLLKDPVFIPDVDYLIIESTYGNRTHPSIKEAKEKLMVSINRTLARGGKVIIPSFALERTQEVLYFLKTLIQERKLPHIPIFLDSPLAINVTEVFRQHENYLDRQTCSLIQRGIDPFPVEEITYIRRINESKELNRATGPMIIIAGSGMCESGRILHHLKNNIEDEKNTVLVVGYMAENTLGKRIVERTPIVKIFGEEYKLNAEVVVINAFSGHADKNDLIDYVKHANGTGRLKNVFVVHGDLDQSEALRQSLNDLGYPAYLPQIDEELELE